MADNKAPTPVPKRILFFDSECNLCNRSVQYIYKLSEADSSLFFSSLDSSTAKGKLPKEQLKLKEEVVLLWDDSLYNGSAAINFLLQYYAEKSLIARLLLIIPEFLQRSVYKWIARNRKHLKLRTCSFDPELAKRIIS